MTLRKQTRSPTGTNTKLALVIHNARTTLELKAQAKPEQMGSSVDPIHILNGDWHLFSVQPRNSWHRYVQRQPQNLSLYIFDPYSPPLSSKSFWRSLISQPTRCLSTSGWFAPSTHWTYAQVHSTRVFGLSSSRSSNWRITILTWRLQLSTNTVSASSEVYIHFFACCLLGNCTNDFAGRLSVVYIVMGTWELSCVCAPRVI